VEAIGEVRFEDDHGLEAELLVKFLFTSESTSIQVHPDDRVARRAGYRRGKDEAWIVLTAEPQAVIGRGLRTKMSRAALRRAALDGSIDRLIEWRPVQAGDVYFSPAGTLHAIGGGMSLVEIQQNADLTYRLYDYGRSRKLQVEAGIAASRLEVSREPATRRRRADGGEILVEGAAFVLERRNGPAAGRLLAAEDREVWLVPVSGRTVAEGEHLAEGAVAVANAPVSIAVEPGAELLLAYPGAEPLDPLIV
jgi:mannose-6-phosphate isomerase